jgi:hypothetical protein
MARRRLCVGPERDEEIAALLPRSPRRMVTIWALLEWFRAPRDIAA